MKNSDQPAFANKIYPEFGKDFIEKFSVTGMVNPTGLTKREYFATMAMQGLSELIFTQASSKWIANRSIELADELLKQLES